MFTFMPFTFSASKGDGKFTLSVLFFQVGSWHGRLLGLTVYKKVLAFQLLYLPQVVRHFK